MTRRLRLLAAAAPLGLIFAAPAIAQDVTTARTTPVTTSTADGGAPSDVTITSSGSVTVETGVAVTVDSDNSVTNNGTIRIDDVNDTTGVLLEGGATGDFTNTGAVLVQDTARAKDNDGDGDFDTPFAKGARRVGVLIDGASAFNGNVTNEAGGLIRASGRDSAGVRVRTDLVGDITNASELSAEGDRAVGLDIKADVTGDIINNGGIGGSGMDAVGISLKGDLDGVLANSGGISSTGYREGGRRNSEAARALLDADDTLQGGPALAIGGSITGGFVQGLDTTTTPQINVLGQAAAVLISAGWDPARATDVVLGIVEAVEGDQDYGFWSNGVISTNGIHDGIPATAIRIEGTDVLSAIIQGGMYFGNNVSAIAYDAETSAVWFGLGGETPLITIDDAGIVQATSRVVNDETTTAYGLRLDAGASVTELAVDGALVASVTGGPGNAFAILDQSNSLALITNTGLIGASIDVDADDDLTGLRVAAADLSASTIDVTYTQMLRTVAEDEPDPIVPSTTGNVLFGSGSDTLNLLAGTLVGDVSFGDGADAFTLDGDSTFLGGVSDSDGDLALNVLSGSFQMTSTGVLNLTTADFGDDGRYGFLVDTTAGAVSAGSLDVSGAVTVADGAQFGPEFNGLLGEAFTGNVITAGALTVDGDIADKLSKNTPFLYETTLALAPGDPNAIIVTVTPKTAAQLGLNVNQAALYGSALEALSGDVALGAALASLQSQNDVLAAFDQLLPEYAGAALQFAVANVDGAVGAVGNRLDAVRGGRDAAAGVWIQEFATYLDHEDSGMGDAYRGDGFGIAAGVDRPFGPFYAVGLSGVIASSRFEQPTTFDDPLSVTSFELGAYAAAQLGRVMVDFYGAGGADYFDSSRTVRLGAFESTATADWTGYHAASSLRAAIELNPNGRFFVRPAVSVDYLMLEEQGYSESGGGTGVDLEVDDRSSDIFSSTASLSVGGTFNRNGRVWWSPRLRAGYRVEHAGDAGLTSARFVGSPDFFDLQAGDLPDSGAIFGFTFAAGSRYSSFAFDYDADLRDGFDRHVARLAFRFLF